MALARFDKQPNEVRDYDVLFGPALDEFADEAQPGNPIDIAPVPEGITLDSVTWLPTERIMKFWVSGGVVGRHTLTAWLNTAGGRRWEADIQIQVKEIT